MLRKELEKSLVSDKSEKFQEMVQHAKRISEQNIPLAGNTPNTGGERSQIIKRQPTDEEKRKNNAIFRLEKGIFNRSAQLENLMKFKQRPDEIIMEALERYKAKPTELNRYLLEYALNKVTLASNTGDERIKKLVDTAITTINSKKDPKEVVDFLISICYEHPFLLGRSLVQLLPSGMTYFPCDIDVLGGNDLNDKFSSCFVTRGVDAVGGELILFAHPHWVGPFAGTSVGSNIPFALNPDLTSVGFNDTTSSVMLVRRFQNEISIDLGDLGIVDLIDRNLDITGQSQGYLSKRGNTIFTWDMWPRGYDPVIERWHPNDSGSIFLLVIIPVTVNVPWWFDYDAEFWFWINLYVDNAGSLQGFAEYWGVWVDGGIIGGEIFDRLMHFMQDNWPSISARIDDMLNTYLPLINSFGPFTGRYYLPGHYPAGAADFRSVRGSTGDGVTLVLTK